MVLGFQVGIVDGGACGFGRAFELAEIIVESPDIPVEVFSHLTAEQGGQLRGHIIKGVGQINIAIDDAAVPDTGIIAVHTGQIGGKACLILGSHSQAMGLLMSVLTERGLMDQAVVPRVELGLVERDYGSYERGPQADVPANVWDPGDALLTCGGEGNASLRARVLAALRGLLAPENVSCALAVSHGSASKQFLAAVLPAEKDVPKVLPNCAVIVCDFDEAHGEFFVRDIVDPCA